MVKVRFRHWSQQRLRLAKELVAIHGREQPARAGVEHLVALDAEVHLLEEPPQTVAVQLGVHAAYRVAAGNTPPDEVLQPSGKVPLLIDAVIKGHADFGVNDASAVKGQVATFPPNSIRILPEVLSKEPLSFAVRYDSPDLLAWINLFFLHQTLNGRLDQNLNYWVNSEDWKKDH